VVREIYLGVIIITYPLSLIVPKSIFLRGLTEGTVTAMVFRPEIEERRKTG
jgi:hypothetical protein